MSNDFKLNLIGPQSKKYALVRSQAEPSMNWPAVQKSICV